MRSAAVSVTPNAKICGASDFGVERTRQLIGIGGTRIDDDEGVASVLRALALDKAAIRRNESKPERGIRRLWVMVKESRELIEGGSTQKLYIL